MVLNSPDSGRGFDVTVGFDGSPASQEALRWAVGHAGGPSTSIHLLGTFDVGPDESEETVRSRTEDVLGTAVAALESQDRIDWVARRGDPVEVLLQWSSSTDLLVVGRHGTSHLIRNAMGSVSDACVRLAACPVVVVPPPR